MPWTFHLRTTHGSMTEAERATDAAGHTPAHAPQPGEAELAPPEHHTGDELPHDD